MPSPKTPQAIIREFHDKFPHLLPATSTMVGKDYMTDLPDFITDWLRSSMQSLLLHVMGEMRREVKRNEEFYVGHECCMSHESGNPAPIYCGQRNSAITDCITVIQSTIDSIKE